MPAMVVLAVGTDIPTSTRKAYEQQELFLTLARTTDEAAALLQYGDFDLCAVGHSVSGESKKQLIYLLRRILKSRIPVISLSTELRSVDDLRVAVSAWHSCSLLMVSLYACTKPGECPDDDWRLCVIYVLDRHEQRTSPGM